MPAAERLKAIAQRQAELQQRIARDRRDCTVHGAELVRPLEGVEHALRLWREYAPLVKIGLGLWKLWPRRQRASAKCTPS